MTSPTPQLNATISEQFESVVASMPDKPAIRFYGETCDYGELGRLANRWAGALVALGVRAGDAVAVCTVAVPEFTALFFGIVRIGAIAVPINPDSVEHDVRTVVRRTNARVLVMTTDTVAIGEPVVDTEGMAGVVIERSRVQPGCDPYAGGSSIRATDLLADVGGTPLDDVAYPNPDTAAVIWFTSGTTGTPKGAPWSHRDLVANVIDKWGSIIPFGPDEVQLAAAPMGHNGSAPTVVAPFLRGSTIELLRSVTPREMADHLVDGDVTFFLTAPAIMRLVLNSVAERGGGTARRLRHLLIGGASVTPAMFRELAEFAPGATVYYGYGASEGNICSRSLSVRSHDLESVGPPFPGVEVQIRGDDGLEVALGEVGHVHIRGAGILRRYWNEPADSCDAEGWLPVNDLGRRDEDGWIWIVGRKRDAIMSGGYNVIAGEVETALLEHPSVHEVAVIGQPDDILVESIVAFVVGDGADDDLERRLRAFCDQRLTKYKRPRQYVFVDEFPKTSIGKIQKHLLDPFAPRKVAP